MDLNASELYEGLQKGSREHAAASGLFQKLLGGKTRESMGKNQLLENSFTYLREQSEAFRKKEIPELSFGLFKLFDTNGNRTLFQDAYFERRERFLVYCLAAWLWKKPEDIAALEDIIWAICDEYSWCLPAHMGGKSLLPRKDKTIHGGIVTAPEFDNSIKLDLFSCETGFALAEGCAMLEAVLSPLVLERARNETYRRLIKSYLEYGALQHWELLEMNWCAVCGGSLGAAAMYLIEDDLFLAGILQKLMPTFERFIRSFSSDGVCIEGLSYWTYGISFYVTFANLLFHRTGGKVDLLADPRFAAIARFQQYGYFSGGDTLSFSDAHSAGFKMGLSSLLAERFDDIRVPPKQYLMDLQTEQRGRFSPTLRDFIWTDEKYFRPFEIPRCTVFPDAQWMLCRTGETAFAAKGGHNDEPHNHNDVGNFIYYKKGKMVFCDLGAGEYTKAYFNEDRYTIFCNRSDSHNVPIINGQGQEAGQNYRAKNCDMKDDGTMSLDIGPAYNVPGLESLKRDFHFDVSSGALTLKDTFVFDSKAQPIKERFITLYVPRIENEKVFIDTGEAQCVLCPSEKVVPAVSEFEHRGHDGNPLKVYCIDFSYLPSDKVFSVEFTI
jgi:hypothetical protein